MSSVVKKRVVFYVSESDDDSMEKYFSDEQVPKKESTVIFMDEATTSQFSGEKAEMYVGHFELLPGEVELDPGQAKVKFQQSQFRCKRNELESDKIKLDIEQNKPNAEKAELTIVQLNKPETETPVERVPLIHRKFLCISLGLWFSILIFIFVGALLILGWIGFTKLLPRGIKF